MTDRIGVPWVERFGLVLLISWFIALMSLGTYLALYPVFDRYLERLREGHQVRALQQDITRWQERLTLASAEFNAIPLVPEAFTLSEWLAGVQAQVQVIEVEVVPNGLVLSVQGRSDHLWAWLEGALPTWGGLTATDLQLRGQGTSAQLQVSLAHHTEIRLWPAEPFDAVMMPVWGPLSPCPSLELVSRIGRTVHLQDLAGVEQVRMVSEWLDADWQLIHVSGKALQWRSRLGTLCQAVPAP